MTQSYGSVTLGKFLSQMTKNYSERIKALGLSKRDFCKIAGIHENTLYNMKNPRIATLEKIEETLSKLEG